MPRTLLPLLLLVLPLAAALLHGGPHALAAACFATIVGLWFTESLPLAATGLLVPVLCIAYGLLSSTEAFGAFGHPILFLFLGSFLLVRGMQVQGLDQRVARFLLSRRAATHSLSALTAVLGATCWALSMWMSNTAAAAIMTPVVLGIIDTLRPHLPDDGARRSFATRTLLLTAFACSIGGLATPMGSPPNMLALSFLADQDIELSVLDWMIFGVPLAATMLVLLLALLAWRYPAPALSLEAVREDFAAQRKTQGPATAGERAVAGCFLMAIVLWLAPGVAELVSAPEDWTQWLSAHLPLGGVAVAAALPLFALPGEDGEPVLTWDDAKAIDWGTIMLFGGGLCLGKMLDTSGLAEVVGSAIFGGGIGTMWTVAGVVLFAILLSEFGSNTASAAVLIPLLVAAFPDGTEQALTGLVVAAALGASFGFMLPVSTPPNAIVFGTGRLQLRDMVTTGVLFDVSGWLLVTAAMAALAG